MPGQDSVIFRERKKSRKSPTEYRLTSSIQITTTEPAAKKSVTGKQGISDPITDRACSMTRRSKNLQRLSQINPVTIRYRKRFHGGSHRGQSENSRSVLFGIIKEFCIQGREVNGTGKTLYIFVESKDMIKMRMCQKNMRRNRAIRKVKSFRRNGRIYDSNGTVGTTEKATQDFANSHNAVEVGQTIPVAQAISNLETIEWNPRG